jgi:hypothetical protein
LRRESVGGGAEIDCGKLTTYAPFIGEFLVAFLITQVKTNLKEATAYAQTYGAL